MAQDTLKLDGFDTLRITDSEWIHLIDGLDRTSATQTPDEDHRQHERMPFRGHAQIAISVQHPGGNICHFLVRPRDLSNNGMGFLHGSFLHHECRCMVKIANHDGRVLTLEGRIKRCIHLEGRVHLIGLQFQQDIDATAFI